jgi:dihydroflavonol-4-reductase
VRQEPPRTQAPATAAVEKGPVFLTGATGFLGSHVLDALVEAGYPVRVLLRGMPERWPELDGITPVVGDLLQPGELVPALRGCSYLMHVAALYSFAPRDRELVWRTNVDGCAGLLEAARIAGVEKAVVTSSSAAVGPAGEGQPATEADHPPVAHTYDYHGSKAEEEVVALAARLPVVLVLPTAPVGPGDRGPTPTGRIVLDFLCGRMRATVRGGMNLVPVEDVARGHVLALERGWPGQRYLLGGEDLTFDEIWGLLARVSGRRAPRCHLPHALVMAMAHLDELRCTSVGGRPRVPVEGARMSRQLMYASSDRAARELGWWAGPAAPALERAVQWYRSNGLA